MNVLVGVEQIIKKKTNRNSSHKVLQKERTGKSGEQMKDTFSVTAEEL